MEAQKLQLERETCSRCGGSGHYSYCQRYGTRCFKCGGKGVVLSKRGAVAKAYLTRLRSRPACELKPGDKVRGVTVTMSGDLFGQWRTVVALRPYDSSGNHTFINGVEQPQRTDLIQIETAECTMSGVAPESLYEVLLSKEQQRETFQAALAYQDMLTKAEPGDFILSRLNVAGPPRWRIKQCSL